LKETYRPSTNKDVDFDRFIAIFEALPITEALPIEALPVDTNKLALLVDTDTNEPPKPDSFTFEALLLDIDECNQLAIPSTEPSIFPLETYEPVNTDNPLETDELAIPSANTTEPSVEDALTFNTLTSPPSPLHSIPATGFEQLHTLQRTNGSATPTYTSATPTFTEFGQFQALQRTGVG
jgi:hypothetical protein